jgi:hypothetical protein
MVSNQIKADERQRQSGFDGLFNDRMPFNFDVWAVAVRQQMLASLKKREGGRSNWD